MERDDEANFARRMAELRQNAGMSQSELARQMVERGYDSYSQTTVSRTEKGDRPIRLGEARVLAEILGGRVEEMTRGTDLEELLVTADKVKDSGVAAMLGVAREMVAYVEFLEWSREIGSRLSRFDDDAARASRQELSSYEYSTSVVGKWAAELALDAMRDAPEALVWTDHTRLMELQEEADGLGQAEA